MSRDVQMPVVSLYLHKNSVLKGVLWQHSAAGGPKSQRQKRFHKAVMEHWKDLDSQTKEMLNNELGQKTLMQAFSTKPVSGAMLMSTNGSGDVQAWPPVHHTVTNGSATSHVGYFSEQTRVTGSWPNTWQAGSSVQTTGVMQHGTGGSLPDAGSSIDPSRTRRRLCLLENGASRSPSTAEVALRVRCALLPLCKHPKQDLATPAKVTLKAAHRLRKRAERERRENGAEKSLIGFPWNEGTRAVVAKKSLVMSRLRFRESDISCPVCAVSNGRACNCGAKFADATDTRALTSYVHFVRRSSTPVYEEDSPEDQWRLVSTMAEIFVSEDKREPGSDSWEALVRFVMVASFSGRPDTVDSLKGSLVPTATHPVFLEALAEHVREKKPFWRGGQAHGGLATSEISGAYGEFFTHHSSTLAAKLQTWNNATTVSERSDAVRVVHESLTACRGIFKAGDYFIKRAFEICVLAGTRGIAGFRRGASDLDLIADIWPIGPGTRSGLHKIWPTGLRTQQDQRQALRVLQRALGGGCRRVPLVRISAFLCFWQRALNGTLPWQVTAIS